MTNPLEQIREFVAECRKPYPEGAHGGRYADGYNDASNDIADRLQAILTARQGYVCVPVGFNFAAHLARQAAWSEKTFGPGSRTEGVVDHIRKELREIEADPGDLKEWIDVVILALDGAWRLGAKPQEIIDAIAAKQTKNEGRVWPDWRTVDPTKAIEHDRSQDKCDAWSCKDGVVVGPYDTQMVCSKCNGAGVLDASKETNRE